MSLSFFTSVPRKVSMLLDHTNTRQLLDSALPPDCHIERSTIFRGDVPIADVVVNAAGVFVNSFYFAFGEIPERRIEGLRKWLSC